MDTNTNTNTNTNTSTNTNTTPAVSPGGQNSPPQLSTKAETIKQAVLDYIALHQQLGTFPEPAECAGEVLLAIKSAFDVQNIMRPQGMKWSIPHDLPTLVIPYLLVARGDVALIAAADDDEAILDKSRLPIAIHQLEGGNRGTWQVCVDPYGPFGELLEAFIPGLSRRLKQEIYTSVRNKLPIIKKCCIPYYVAVNNGIYDVKNKKLMDFDKDIVFTAKISTNLNLAATNPFIFVDEDGSTWDVEGWFESLAPNEPDLCETLWEVVQAGCMPLVPRNKMVLLYSETGNNGKGTLCELIRLLIGKGRTASIAINEFEQPFALANLPYVVAIITDENDVNSYSKQNAKLKAVITGDPVTVNGKGKPQFDYAFRGLVLQCVNDLPTVSDKTGSFRRRMLIIKMPSCFTGVEKKYIKNRLIKDTRVKEYILKRVLVDMDYRESFTESESSKKMNDEYMLVSNSVHAFCVEILPQCAWNFLPARIFLYELYKEHYRRAHPSGKPVGRNDFYKGLKEFVNDPKNNSEFVWSASTRCKDKMNMYEPLLREYNLRHLQNSDWNNHSTLSGITLNWNVINETYSGLLRKSIPND